VSKTVTNKNFNGYQNATSAPQRPTDRSRSKSASSPFEFECDGHYYYTTVMNTVAKISGFILYAGAGISTWHFTSASSEVLLKCEAQSAGLGAFACS
jgi:hypothetical protein